MVCLTWLPVQSIRASYQKHTVNLLLNRFLNMLPWQVHCLRSENIFSSLFRWQRSQRLTRGFRKKRKSRYAMDPSVQNGQDCWIFDFRVGLYWIPWNFEAHGKTQEYMKCKEETENVLSNKMKDSVGTWLISMNTPADTKYEVTQIHGQCLISQKLTPGQQYAFILDTRRKFLNIKGIKPFNSFLEHGNEKSK